MIAIIVVEVHTDSAETENKPFLGEMMQIRSLSDLVQRLRFSEKFRAAYERYCIVNVE